MYKDFSLRSTAVVEHAETTDNGDCGFGKLSHQTFVHCTV